MAILKDSSIFEPQLLRRTPEGYLTGRIRVTCAGVFRYLGEDGKTIVRVLRPESEVGAPESVVTANSKPVTLQHPKDMVNAGNVKKYEVGFTGTDAEFDGIDLWITVTITDPKAIEAIEKGEVAAVSMGYDVQSVEVNEDPLNNWRGTEYTHIQHGIRYNHLALVYAGRAGESVEIAVGDSFEIFKTNKTGHTPAKDSAMKKIIIDGAVYECDEAVAAKVAGLEKQLADSAADHKAELDKVTAERDAAQAEVKTLKESAKDEAEIARLVEEKIKLVDTAKKYGCEVKAEDSAIDIKKAVISKAFGDKMDLKDKSAEYVGVAFDSACIHLDSVSEKKPVGDGSPFAPDFKNFIDNQDCDTEKAHQAMLDAMTGKSAKKGE